LSLFELLLNEVLIERFVLAELRLPEPLSAWRVQVPHVEARDGWLALTWKLTN
jgi:hypothetical protein